MEIRYQNTISPPTYSSILIQFRLSLRSILMANVQDCYIQVSNFKLKTSYHIHFHLGKLSLYHLSYALNNTTNIFLKVSFGKKVIHEVWYAIKVRNLSLFRYKLCINTYNLHSYMFQIFYLIFKSFQMYLFNP